MEKKVVRSTIYNGACLPGLSLFRVSHTRLRWPVSLSHHWSLTQTHPVRRGKGSAVASLSHRWSLIPPHPVRRGKGRKCIVSPFNSAEAARPDLRYTLFSLTKLRRGRAYATCSMPQYGQIPPAAAHLITSR